MKVDSEPLHLKPTDGERWLFLKSVRLQSTTGRVRMGVCEQEDL